LVTLVKIHIYNILVHPEGRRDAQDGDVGVRADIFIPAYVPDFFHSALPFALGLRLFTVSSFHSFSG
jgi:hypothetical protein